MNVTQLLQILGADAGLAAAAWILLRKPAVNRGVVLLLFVLSSYLVTIVNFEDTRIAWPMYVVWTCAIIPVVVVRASERGWTDPLRPILISGAIVVGLLAASFSFPCAWGCPDGGWWLKNGWLLPVAQFAFILAIWDVTSLLLTSAKRPLAAAGLFAGTWITAALGTVLGGIYLDASWRSTFGVLFTSGATLVLAFMVLLNVLASRTATRSMKGRLLALVPLVLSCAFAALRRTLADPTLAGLMQDAYTAWWIVVPIGIVASLTLIRDDEPAPTPPGSEPPLVTAGGVQ